MVEKSAGRISAGWFDILVTLKRKGRGIVRKMSMRFPVGLRTMKTAVAVLLSMLAVSSYGATESRLVFAR